MQLDAEQLITVLAEKIGNTTPDIGVVGIHTGGVWVADKLAAKIGATRVGRVAVTLHRDDYATRGLHPQKNKTEFGFDVNGQHILLVDDVLQSGRTVRAALNELFDFGRPASVKLAALVDRGGRELPVQADYIAITMPLAGSQKLELTNTGGALRFEILEG
ncbi:MAG: bifunctional pyr operon transcriptional regulator/uracil phosphoribosyltransferase PyrR [Rhodocyclaceae bacterium]|jgi:pyrimidine operon attenuation protein/uracil phosphoribosyltransferase|nr:bifunctional pyr operon transcriptional regulator/uracil phosphoribosyltransferase PyrR [Rhodocyclaceae bacterium]MCA3021709.1 bifunctional pyr operon transcriptional regulator/uracil phosphoribosyltransferase PyrR [Rhodocyclaceae bacterium]MCA3027849.1 bifunctional pyr operon transcriptional regulator/uracil phosphoribosyltransferase PyrR [Rhodocyclaceae bacterium]MCA3043255.1 bifunctional pyr operon transcriptional regulator/uracil phosphoribosyltransferase PyrR [Rhodocyclaceae bacterium]M